MNICFLIGKIASDIEFNFILNGSNISIVEFYIELGNSICIKIKGYNEIADECYSKLIKNDRIGIYGYLNNKMEVIIEEFERE